MGKKSVFPEVIYVSEEVDGTDRYFITHIDKDELRDSCACENGQKMAIYTLDSVVTVRKEIHFDEE